jgi:hypothetical protein
VHSRALDKAITPIRISTYLAGPGHDPVLARRLYVWDRDVSVALLADIAILEVALRNALNDRLSSSYGAEWYRLDIGLDGRSRDTLSRAWAELPQGRKTPGHLVARLMFGFWRDLLSAGGFVGKEPQRFPTDYESLWRTTLHKAFPGGRAIASAEGSHFTRSWTLETVAVVHAVRNRPRTMSPSSPASRCPGSRSGSVLRKDTRPARNWRDCWTATWQRGLPCRSRARSRAPIAAHLGVRDSGTGPVIGG